jgi:hypothetical protein
MKKFLIAEAEKARILGMHYNAMGKTLVNEQEVIPDNITKAYVEAVNNMRNGGEYVKSYPSLLEPERIKNKSYAVGFSTNVNNRGTLNYQCIDADPTDGNQFKAGQIYDSNLKLTNVATELDAGKTPWRTLFSWACKPAMAVLASRQPKPQAQVAAQTATAPDTTMSDLQKRGAENTKKLLQTNEQLRTMLADDQYLNPNKEKIELDNDVNQITSFLATKAPSGDDSMALKNKIRVLLKYKPEYGRDPYFLTPNF